MAIFERFISVTLVRAWLTIHTMSNKTRSLNMQDMKLLENLFISAVHRMPCPFPGVSRDFWIAFCATWKCLPWNSASSKLLITRIPTCPTLLSSLWNAIKYVAPYVGLPSLFWLSFFVLLQASPWTSLGWFTLWMAPWSGGLIRMGSSQLCWVPMTWHLLGLSAVTLLWTFLRWDSGLVLFLQNESLQLHPCLHTFVCFPSRSDKEVRAPGHYIST